jgi:RHS repeat-associated protein
MDLTKREMDSIFSTRIPTVYSGRRSSETYELTRYVNDVNREHTEVLMEYSGSSRVKARYTYGNGRLYTSNAAAEGLTGKTVAGSYYYDGHGSVSSLHAFATGTMLTSYAYGPFGESSLSPPPYQGSHYGYSGEKYEPTSSLQYLRARYYSPDIGRFTVADTYPGRLIDPLSMNKYAYCLNDPVNFIDPSGHCSSSVWGKVDCGKPSCSSSKYYVRPAPRNMAAEAAASLQQAATIAKMNELVKNTNTQMKANLATVQALSSAAQAKNSLAQQQLVAARAAVFSALESKKYCTGEMPWIGSLASMGLLSNKNLKLLSGPKEEGLDPGLWDVLGR